MLCCLLLQAGSKLKRSVFGHFVVWWKIIFEFNILLQQSTSPLPASPTSFFTDITMPRLVRRQPLAERIKSYLNPLDFLLWLSEEIDANDWEQFEKNWALPLGVTMNIVFMIARANSRQSGSRAVDDVFGDGDGVSLMSWLVSGCL